MKILIMAGLLLLAFPSCQSWDQQLTLVNKSEQTIYYWVTCDSSYKNIQFRNENKLEPGGSTQPYLIYSAEGKGKHKSPWVNAINLADDSALHVFCYYFDHFENLSGNNNTVDMRIKRLDFRADSLEKLGWVVRYY